MISWILLWRMQIKILFHNFFKKVRWYNCNSSTVTFIPSSISKFMIDHLEKSSICKFGLWIHYCLHTIPLQFLVNISKIYLHSFKKEARFTYWTGKQTRYNIQRTYSFFYVAFTTSVGLTPKLKLKDA